MKTTESKKTTATKKDNKKEDVKAKSDAATGLTEFFEDGLKDIYWAEKALTKALPKMSKNATSPELVKALDNHLKETEEQITRLESVFKRMSLLLLTKSLLLHYEFSAYPLPFPVVSLQ